MSTEGSIKIERLPVPKHYRRDRVAIEDFCAALRKLKVGESFAYGTNSYHRLGLSWAQVLLERKFMIREGRVWRLK
jgi:hypothetical protein